MTALTHLALALVLVTGCSSSPNSTGATAGTKTGRASPSCDQQLATARSLAEANEHTRAIGAFKNLQLSCGSKISNDHKILLISELAFEYHLLGDDAACLETLKTAQPGWDAASQRAMKGILNKARLCEQRPEHAGESCNYNTDDSTYCELSLLAILSRRKEFAGSSAKPCPLSGAAKGAVEIGHSPVRCIEILKAERDEDGEEDVYHRCATISVLESSGRKLSRRDVDRGETSLADPDNCCRLAKITTITHDMHGPVIIFSSGEPERSCHGSNNFVDYFEVYRLNDYRLEVVKLLTFAVD